MKTIICESYSEMSEQAALIIAEQIKEKKNSVLGLATGSTPLGMYKALCEMYSKNQVDFSQVVSVNLDEYFPIKKSSDQSYYYFMHHNLFSHINILPENINIPDGEAENADEECKRYEQKIADLGGIDLQILGIGINGHIGFNEPGEFLYSDTHKTPLTQSTIEANSRFFNSADEVPKNALTMGVASIMKSKKILLLASGANKHAAISSILSGKITTSCPATLLNLHSDLIIICDKEAYYGN